MMKTLGLCLAIVGLMAAGCGGDDDKPPADSAVGNQVDGAPGPDGAGGGGAAPVINSVSWTTPAGCTAGTASDYTITIDVDDTDTAANALTFSGTLTGCTGEVNTNPATVSCPNLAAYPGTITVMDPEGNSDSQAINVTICTDGSAP